MAITISFTKCEQNIVEPQSTIEYGFEMPTPSEGVDWTEVDALVKSEQTTLRAVGCIEYDRDCKRLSWSPKQTVVDTSFHASFYVVTNRLKTGPCAGLWQSPKGEFAKTWYDLNDNWFLRTSYVSQVSETVLQKVKGQLVVYPAHVRFQNGILTVKHHTSSYEDDIEDIAPEPAIWIVDFNTPTPDTTWTRWNCDRQFESGTGSWE